MTTKIKPVKKVRLCFIGLGRIFRLGYTDWLEKWLREHPQVELAGLSDVDEELCRKYQRKFRAPYFTDPLELLGSGKVNAVVISTPNWAHEEQVIAAAENGVHVLCEKPMAPTAAACERMNRACGDAGVFLQICFMRRFSPAFQRIKQLVMREKLGDILELNWDWPYFIVDLDSPPYAGIVSWIEEHLGYPIRKEWGAWRLKDPRSGGGDFLDHGPHICDLFSWFAGKITHVSAETRTIIEGRNEDFTSCRLRFENGAVGNVTTTLYDFAGGLNGRVHGFVRGTKARVDFIMPDTNRFKPVWLIHYRMPETDIGKVIRAFGLMKGRPEFFRRTLLFKDQLDYFVSTVRGEKRSHKIFGGDDFAATGEDGLYTIKIVEKVYESANSAPSWLPVK